MMCIHAIYEKHKKQNLFFLVTYIILFLCCVFFSVRFEVLLSVPVYVKVCECSKGSSLAPFCSETDLRRASGALSERFGILVPEQCLGPFQRSGAPGETHLRVVPLSLHMPTTEWSNTLFKETYFLKCVWGREKILWSLQFEDIGKTFLKSYLLAGEHVCEIRVCFVN